jgi:hypothetical protein
MTQDYKKAFKARATSLRGRRVASAFKVVSALRGPINVYHTLFFIILHYNRKIITQNTILKNEFYKG